MNDADLEQLAKQHLTSGLLTKLMALKPSELLKVLGARETKSYNLGARTGWLEAHVEVGRRKDQREITHQEILDFMKRWPK